MTDLTAAVAAVTAPATVVTTAAISATFSVAVTATANPETNPNIFSPPNNQLMIKNHFNEELIATTAVTVVETAVHTATMASAVVAVTAAAKNRLNIMLTSLLCNISFVRLTISMCHLLNAECVLPMAPCRTCVPALIQAHCICIWDNSAMKHESNHD